MKVRENGAPIGAEFERPGIEWEANRQDNQDKQDEGEGALGTRSGARESEELVDQTDSA